MAWGKRLPCVSLIARVQGAAVRSAYVRKSRILNVLRMGKSSFWPLSKAVFSDESCDLFTDEDHVGDICAVKERPDSAAIAACMLANANCVKRKAQKPQIIRTDLQIEWTATTLTVLPIKYKQDMGKTRVSIKRNYQCRDKLYSRVRGPSMRWKETRRTGETGVSLRHYASALHISITQIGK